MAKGTNTLHKFLPISRSIKFEKRPSFYTLKMLKNSTQTKSLNILLNVVLKFLIHKQIGKIRSTTFLLYP